MCFQVHLAIRVSSLTPLARPRAQVPRENAACQGSPDDCFLGGARENAVVPCGCEEVCSLTVHCFGDSARILNRGLAAGGEVDSSDLVLCCCHATSHRLLPRRMLWKTLTSRVRVRRCDHRICMWCGCAAGVPQYSSGFCALLECSVTTAPRKHPMRPAALWLCRGEAQRPTHGSTGSVCGPWAAVVSPNFRRRRSRPRVQRCGAQPTEARM